jgi:hypothetical protein
MRRGFVVVWVLFALLGALGVDLGLPWTRYRHDMFHENPRRVRVGHFTRDGVDHDLADLVATPSLGYKRSRVALNLIAHPDYIRELCYRGLRSPDDAFTVTVDEYQGDRRPTHTLQLQCDAHGVAPR